MTQSLACHCRRRLTHFVPGCRLPGWHLELLPTVQAAQQLGVPWRSSDDELTHKFWTVVSAKHRD